MKHSVKIITLILITVLFVSMLPPMANAMSNVEEHTEYIYFEDGSYLKISITSIETRSLGSRSGSKKMEYTNSNGEILWYAILRGNFTYDGTIAVCNSSSCDVVINASNYEIVSKTVGKRSNYAYVNLTIGLRLLGVLINEENYSLTLSCSKDGILS